MKFIFGVFLMVGLFSLSSFGADKELPYIICKNAGVGRTIRVEPGPQNQGCVVQYTKGGVDQEVGNGEALNGCEVIADRVKANLEKHWWKCRSLKQYTLSQPTNR